MLKPEHIRALRQNGFPPEMVLISFDATTLQRGVHYFETRRVLELSSDFPSLSEVQLTAVVLGSSKYQVTVTIDLNQHHIRSQCSCPVGQQCKHAVAALLHYVGHRIPTNTPKAAEKPPAPSAVQLWLADLNTQALPNQAAADDNDTSRMELIYLLDQRYKNSNRVEINPRKANRLKRGGFGQGYPVPLDDLLYNWKTTPFQYTSQDADISQLVLPHNSYQTIQNVELKGQVGRIALDLMLQTGRTFWQKADYKPLKAAPARTLEFKWEERDHTRSIRPQTTPALQDYFWLDNLYYVDYLRGECGPLEHEPLTAEQVVKLLSAPPIPLTEAADVSHKLLAILPEAEIPLPDPSLNPQIIPVQSATVKAHLILQSEGEATGEALNQYRLSLSFIYDDHQIRPTSQQQVYTQRNQHIRYRIERQLDLENNYRERLQSFGFSPCESHPLDFSVQVESPTLRALRWNHFLEVGLTELEWDGWHIEYASDFNLAFSTIDDWEAQLSQSNENWFEISLGFVVEGKRINLLPILVEMLSQMRDPQELKQLLSSQSHLLVPFDDNHWLKLESTRLQSVLNTLIELYDHEPLTAEGNLVLSRFQGNNLAELLNDTKLVWHGAEALRELTTKLENFQGIPAIPFPDGLQAELRPYQQQGLNWLQFLRDYRFNGVLADDMGLGKTLQALSHLLVEKKAGRNQYPSLVIAPTSLMSNWRREAEKYTPSLKVLVLHGPEREHLFDTVQNYDLVITTYALVLRDEGFYQQQRFHYLILDEAQAIKNAKAKTTQAIFDLKSEHRLCLTGTPMENHLGEIWSMFHFLMPGFLGSAERFARLYRLPIEKQADQERQHLLRKRLQPFMLRRTKEHVAKELPAKTEITRMVALEGEQRDLYETVRLAMDKKLRDEINSKGFARSQIMILDALLKLRQVCCDPRLLNLTQAKGIQTSAKLAMLLEMLDEMLAEGRKILLFSQFTSMLALIEPELQKRRISFSKLTGQTRDREAAIQAFQEGPAQVFLLSLKAGGTGLNLTAADTVIHYDPWWNPAVEQQATDRAYRIGQDKPVFVYKLLTEETVEEKILKLQTKKQSLAQGLYQERTATESLFDQADLLDLLTPLGNF